MGRKSDAAERLVNAMATLVHRHGYTAVAAWTTCAGPPGVKKGSFYRFLRRSAN